MPSIWTLCASACIAVLPIMGVCADLGSSASIKSTASNIASNMVIYYDGYDSGGIPWGESAEFFNTLIYYWALTGDAQYNDIVGQALQFQQGDAHNYQPANQTESEGNDDQSTWALAAISAAEYKLAVPQDGTAWVDLAEAVFNAQTKVWDNQTCGGGLRWLMSPFSNGYSYKNSISNGQFFQLAARLSLYTGQSAYLTWAQTAFEWSQNVGLVDNDGNIYDGTSTTTNCSTTNKVQFSDAAAAYVAGAAFMYNATTGSSQWKSSLDILLSRTLGVFFPGGVATEVACENQETCPGPIMSYKGQLAQALVNTMLVAPYTQSTIMPVLTSTAQAVASLCNPGGVCPFIWNTTLASSLPFNNSTVGSEMSALSFVQALLAQDAPAMSSQSGASGSPSSSSSAGAGSGAGSGSGATTSPTGTGTKTGATTSSTAKSAGPSHPKVNVATLTLLLAISLAVMSVCS